MTYGSGIGLVPPKRSGREKLVTAGLGNVVIGRGFPHVARGFTCPPNDNERLVRIEKNIRTSFIIVTSDKTFAA